MQHGDEVNINLMYFSCLCALEKNSEAMEFYCDKEIGRYVGEFGGNISEITNIIKILDTTTEGQEGTIFSYDGREIEGESAINDF